jgi:hypothetical protein
VHVHVGYGTRSTSFDQRLKSSRDPARSITDILNQSGLGSHDEKQWPIAQRAKADGLFALTSALIFIDEFTLKTLAASDLKSILFQDIDPNGTPKSDLVIQIYKDDATLKKATGALGPEAANGLFLPDSNTIATFFPANFLDAFYRPVAGDTDTQDQPRFRGVERRQLRGRAVLSHHSG